MPPAAEPVHEQVLDRIVTKFKEIAAGAEYWYTPLVLSVEILDPKLLRASDEVVYQVLDGDTRPTEQTSGSYDEESEIFVMACKRWKPTPNREWSPYNTYTPANPSPRTIRNRLVHDVQKKVYEDVTLGMGDVTLNCEVRDINRDFEIEQGESWVCVELRIVATYTFRSDQP